MYVITLNMVNIVLDHTLIKNKNNHNLKLIIVYNYILTVYRYLSSLAQITSRNHYTGCFSRRIPANIFLMTTVLIIFPRDNL